MNSLSESSLRRLSELRQVLDSQLTQLQQSNATRLEEIRATVDEKLQATLQARLGESFQQVAHRLEQVHQGLGEMQSLAQGVGRPQAPAVERQDARHLRRGPARGFAGAGAGARPVRSPGAPRGRAAAHRVDFAVRMPGRAADAAELWLPIDAKFPIEDYERLLDAQGRADAAGAEAAAKALEARIRIEARSIAEKYLEPPHTTEFAILFLPTEGCTPRCCGGPA